MYPLKNRFYIFPNSQSEIGKLMLFRRWKCLGWARQVDDYAYLLSKLLSMLHFTFRVTWVLQGSLVSWGIQANR